MVEGREVPVKGLGGYLGEKERDFWVHFFVYFLKIGA